MSIDKIGMYKTDEILEFMTEGEGRGFLGRSMFDAMYFEIERLNKQIKEYQKALLDIKEILKKQSSSLDWEPWSTYKVSGDKLFAIAGILDKVLGSDKE